MSNQKGGKGLGGLVGSISKLAKAGSKAATNVAAKATSKVSALSETATNVAAKATEKAYTLSETATNVAGTLSETATNVSAKSGNLFSNADSSVNMNCSCTCTRTRPTTNQIGGRARDRDRQRTLNEASRKLTRMVNSQYSSNNLTEKVSKGLKMLIKAGFDINNDRSYHELLYSSKFDDKPGFKTLLNTYLRNNY